MGELYFWVIALYLFFHFPAIILLVLGLTSLKKNPEKGKKLLILAGIYFLVGAGICGKILYQ